MSDSVEMLDATFAGEEQPPLPDENSSKSDDCDSVTRLDIPSDTHTKPMQCISIKDADGIDDVYSISPTSKTKVTFDKDVRVRHMPPSYEPAICNVPIASLENGYQLMNICDNAEFWKTKARLLVRSQENLVQHLGDLKCELSRVEDDLARAGQNMAMKINESQNPT